MRFVTVCDAAGRAGAEALREALGARVEIVVAETGEGAPPEAWERLGAMYAPQERARALVPFVLADALGRAPEPIVYLAPDVRVLADLEPVESAIAGAAGVFVPRRLSLGADAGSDPVLDDGFAAFSGAGGAELARWWSERVLEHGPGFFWLDRVASTGDRVTVLRHAGCAVAAWNLDERPLSRAPDGALLAAGARVQWLRLPGLDLSRPQLLPGVRLSEQPLLLSEAEAHGTLLRGTAARPAPADVHATTAGGWPLTSELRRLYRQAVAAGDLEHGLATPAGAAAFARWLGEPDPDPRLGGVSRHLASIWRDRPDLRVPYPDLRRSEDRDGFHGWAIVHGRGEYSIPDALLPPTPPGLGLDAPPPAEPVTPPWGVNVAGYFQSEVGVGETARRVIDALDAAHVPVLPVQNSILPPSRREADFGSTDTGLGPFPLNLICVNADGLPAFAADVGPRFFASRWSIGLWWWEIEEFPSRYHGAFDLLDEVWVGTDYVMEALLPAATVPLVKVTVPVEVPPVAPLGRAELGLPADGFLFLYLFDYHSIFERKNPLALVEAFIRAFPPGSGASVVIKSINAASDPDNHERLLIAAQGHPDVHVVDRYVSGAERDAMMAACDCYVSLHRAEGFGQTIAEAMYLGKPVVATGYSGNLDFMSEDTGWLVPYESVPIGPGSDPYPPDARWAEPDADAAARSLREVFDDPDAARERGARAAASIRASHSPEAAGRVMARRLEAMKPRAIERARAFDASTDEAAGRRLTETLRARIATGPEAPPERALSGTRRAARDALLRALKPLIAHQQSIDSMLVGALEEVAGEAQRRSEQARLDQLALYAASLARVRRHERTLRNAGPH